MHILTILIKYLFGVHLVYKTCKVAWDVTCFVVPLIESRFWQLEIIKELHLVNIPIASHG